MVIGWWRGVVVWRRRWEFSIVRKMTRFQRGKWMLEV